MTPDWSKKHEPVPYAKLNNSQSLNLYAYVGNSPLNHVDPDGHAKYCNNKASCKYDDGNNDGKVYVVFNKKEYNAIVAAQSIKGNWTSSILMPGADVRDAIKASVKASNSGPNGGFHEEGGKWGTLNGKQVGSPLVPGGRAIPRLQNAATIDLAQAANPALYQALSLSGTIEGQWHVHPAGIGPNQYRKIMGFEQGPSHHNPNGTGDQDTASSGTNIVVGARSGAVTFFDGSNDNLGQMNLNDFMSLPK
jgi:hypothetical protein